MSEAAAADTDALYAEGQRLMKAGQIQEGFALLGEAAHGGNIEAAHHVAMLAASDNSIPDNWEYALAYVGRAAKGGHRRAQRELAFLAGDADAEAAILRGENLPPETWHRLHDAIKPQERLAGPTPRRVMDSPQITVIENLITPAECDWIVEHAKPVLQRALVYDKTDGSGVSSQIRTNSDMRFSFPDTDLVLMFTGRKICDLVGCHFLEQEDPSVLHYRPGQQFRAHFDFLDPSIPAYAKQLPLTGQRFWTLLIYLNEDYEGGETDFPRLNFRYKGRKGDALLFRNVDAEGKPDRRTLHAGLPPLSGEKWVFSQWIHQHPKA